MDHVETNNAISRAKNTYANFSKSSEGWVTPPKEVDYAIVQVGDNYLISRSRFIGSLDYEVICHCEKYHEAREIVKALNK